MAVKLLPLEEQVIVITGASSGIGLATAHMAAKAGASVVLAARNAEALAEIVHEINAAGGLAASMAVDVGREEEVERLADFAVERFGGIDTWVNDAGVGIWGRLDEVTDEDARRLFDTNYWGVVYGSLAAVKRMKGRGGAIINLGSVASDVALPLQGAYSASKHAVKAFTDTLRVELEHQGEPVSVSLIKPGAVATPMPQHFKSYLEVEGRFGAPLYHPVEVARAILHAATHKVRDVKVGSSGRALSALRTLAPRLYDRLAGTVMYRRQLSGQPAGGHGDNLHQAGLDGRIEGEHPGTPARPSLSTRVARHPLLAGGLLIMGGLAAAALLRRPTVAKLAIRGAGMALAARGPARLLLKQHSRNARTLAARAMARSGHAVARRLPTPALKPALRLMGG